MRTQLSLVLVVSLLLALGCRTTNSVTRAPTRGSALHSLAAQVKGPVNDVEAAAALEGVLRSALDAVGDDTLRLVAVDCGGDLCRLSLEHEAEQPSRASMFALVRALSGRAKGRFDYAPHRTRVYAQLLQSTGESKLLSTARERRVAAREVARGH